MSKVKTITGSECDKGAKYIPSPEQISAECKRIQRGWNRTELRRRAVVDSDAPVETVEFKVTRPNACGALLFH